MPEGKVKGWAYPPILVGRMQESYTKKNVDTRMEKCHILLQRGGTEGNSRFSSPFVSTKYHGSEFNYKGIKKKGQDQS